MTMDVIAHIRTDLPEKFGVPRQSGLVPQLRGTVVFEPAYRNPDALRGLEGFSHLWLIFRFHRAMREGWSPTVRPPRLGGNRRMGVFATRSPFRPNAIGLSCVKLEAVRPDEKLGTVLEVSGADLVDGTPILDIKPYLPYADCRPEATGGFTDPLGGQTLQVSCDPSLLAGLTAEQQAGLMRPPPQVSGRAGAGVRPDFCRQKHKIHRGRRRADRHSRGGSIGEGRALPLPRQPCTPMPKIPVIASQPTGWRGNPYSPRTAPPIHA